MSRRRRLKRRLPPSSRDLRTPPLSHIKSPYHLSAYPDHLTRPSFQAHFAFVFLRTRWSPSRDVSITRSHHTHHHPILLRNLSTPSRVAGGQGAHGDSAIERQGDAGPPIFLAQSSSDGVQRLPPVERRSKSGGCARRIDADGASCFRESGTT